MQFGCYKIILFNIANSLADTIVVDVYNRHSNVKTLGDKLF